MMTKGKKMKKNSSIGTIYFDCFVICPTISRYDNKYHLGTIWRLFYNFSLTYSKPYRKGINNMKMPNGYQGGLLVKQFVHSLKGIAFGWYTDLEPESINN